jgi:hypothetical protein
MTAGFFMTSNAADFRFLCWTNLPSATKTTNPDWRIIICSGVPLLTRSTSRPTQLDHLCNWLTRHKDDDHPKFIVFPTVFVPNPIETAGNENKQEKSDSWPAFYWPFWFADGEPSNCVHDSKKQNDTFVIDEEKGIEMDCIAENFTQKDNFCRVNIDWPSRKMEIRPIDYDGDDIKGKKSVMSFA